MCVSPVLMKNPNKVLWASKFSRHEGSIRSINDNTSYFIYRPCGVCDECIALRQLYTVQRAQVHHLEYDFYFLSMSYSPKMVYTYSVNGYNLSFAEKRDFVNFIKHVRNKKILPYPFTYYAVSEHGSKRHRPHWHAIIAMPTKHLSIGEKRLFAMNLEKKLYDCWAVNIGSKRKPIYQHLCEYVCRRGKKTFDFHFVDPTLSPNGQDDVSFYVTKYILKADDFVSKRKSALFFNLPDDLYKQVWSIVRPRVMQSHSWGRLQTDRQRQHIRKGILLALSQGAASPYFINPSSGNVFPLYKRYYNEMVSVEEAIQFLNNNEFDFDSIDASGVHVDRKSCYDYFNAIEHIMRKRSIMQRSDSSDYEDDDFSDNFGEYNIKVDSLDNSVFDDIKDSFDDDLPF